MEAIKNLIGDVSVIPASIMGFLLLWLIMAKLLFKPVKELLKAREDEIKGTYQAADGKLAEAEELRAGYDKRLAGIEAEAHARLQAAMREAEDAKNQILAEARAHAEDILRKGQENLEREREKMVYQLREEVVNLSIGAAGKLIGESLDEPKQRKLVIDFIDRIGTAK